MAICEPTSAWSPTWRPGPNMAPGVQSVKWGQSWRPGVQHGDLGSNMAICEQTSAWSPVFVLPIKCTKSLLKAELYSLQPSWAQVAILGSRRLLAHRSPCWVTGRHVESRSPCWVQVAMLDPRRHVGSRSPCWAHAAMLGPRRHVGLQAPCWVQGAMLGSGHHVGLQAPCWVQVATLGATEMS